ncbi:dihydropteridine reductase [Lysinibacillus sphaericus]|uniref:NO-inducible flavohemoprotein n=1 Tax=Lysinibacillus sphaericus TaxID=1421 RepID=UPI0018CDD582|nr:NO-inducible flavohemoprotein [Lysinibacillus sphaericus]MBG9455523.1 dihydropteridine reductase [Lysinibacillus sphaericus]MBG9477940.1 dihydropteridine reductase [Lysinibacillus sphaericus]MBG9594080.1 dihydropteridine reductase [Lysinibacillus sphaericus]
MLKQETVQIIKATVPVLEVHGVEITKTFYKNMFQAHPELLNIFNHTNQEKGRQQTALANTVYAAAVHIENLEAILPAVMLIAHKHRSLGILPEHYPIVGENLLKAIKEVLGDAATDDIINAWAEAYGVIADIFIQVEEELYQKAERNGGWRLFKQLKVAKKVVESDLVTSIYFENEDGTPLPAYEPGQYISIRAKVPGEQYLMNRQYTLSQASAEDGYRISVKRESDHTPNGKVSNFIHDVLEVGDLVDVSVPAGLFVLEETSTPITFISGGIGVTPLNSMLQSLTDDATNEVSFIQCARNEKVVAFSDDIKKKVNVLPNASYTALYSDENKKISKELLAEKVADNADVYVCGPVGFMEAIIENLHEIGVKDEKIHYEFFGPAMQLAK